MINKIVWCSIGFTILAILLHNYPLYRFVQRKCAPYKRLKFDITFINREECIRSVEKSQASSSRDQPNHSTLDEIQMRGYVVSSHTIVSKDGYYSTIYRISGGPKSPPKMGKSVVLVFHGGGAAAASWIIQPGSRNLAFTLANAGYEVWLPNARGTTVSKNHTHLDADNDIEYWDSTGMEEMGTQDLPLFVDLILRETGLKKIYYACQSLGCGLFLVGLSEVPELNNKFKAAFHMAPFAFYGSAYNPLFTYITPFLGTPMERIIFRLLGGKMSADPSILANALGLTPENLCKLPAIRCGICDNFLFAIYGANPLQLNYSDFNNIIRKLQDNLPLKTLFHGMQGNEACEFRKYDYGITRNLEKYGSPEPPLYNLSQMTVPTYVFYGETDNFFTPADAKRMQEFIPPKFMKGLFKVESPRFTHIDFLMAKDADVLVYHKIRDIINGLES